MIHGVGKPDGVADKSLVFGAEAVSVPTEGVPGPELLADHLSDLSGGRVIGIVLRVAGGVAAILKAVDTEMGTGLGARLLEIRNDGGVIAFHIVNDAEGMAVAAFVPMARVSRVPECRRIVRLGVKSGRADEGQSKGEQPGAKGWEERGPKAQAIRPAETGAGAGSHID